jgi:hypothetical protein
VVHALNDAGVVVEPAPSLSSVGLAFPDPEEEEVTQTVANAILSLNVIHEVGNLLGLPITLVSRLQIGCSGYGLEVLRMNLIAKLYDGIVDG